MVLYLSTYPSKIDLPFSKRADSTITKPRIFCMGKPFYNYTSPGSRYVFFPCYTYRRGIPTQRLRVHGGLPKAFSATLTQIHTGKVALKSYLHRIKRAPDLRCTCGDEQIGRHVLIECPNFKDLRKAVWPFNSQPQSYKSILNLA